MVLDKSRGQATASVNLPSNDLRPGEFLTQYSPTPSFEQAARKLAARFGLTASVAMVICTLSGLGGMQ